MKTSFEHFNHDHDLRNECINYESQLENKQTSCLPEFPQLRRPADARDCQDHGEDQQPHLSGENSE